MRKHRILLGENDIHLHIMNTPSQNPAEASHKGVLSLVERVGRDGQINITIYPQGMDPITKEWVSPRFVPENALIHTDEFARADVIIDSKGNFEIVQLHWPDRPGTSEQQQIGWLRKKIIDVLTSLFSKPEVS